MAKSKGVPADIFMQFKDLTVLLDGADSSILVEEEVQTGLSVRGKLVWLLHLLEWTHNVAPGATSFRTYIALSTIPGLAVRPALGDRGALMAATQIWSVNTSGGMNESFPKQLRYFPPIPIATPTLAVYAQTDANQVAPRGSEINCRVGFTTAELTHEVYTEIVEVWGW